MQTIFRIIVEHFHPVNEAKCGKCIAFSALGFDIGLGLSYAIIVIKGDKVHYGANNENVCQKA